MAAPGTVEELIGVRSGSHAALSLARTSGSVAATITGDPTGMPLAGVWALISTGKGLAGAGITGSDGTYTVAGLPPGRSTAAIVDPVAGRPVAYWDGGAPPDDDEFVVDGGSVERVDARLREPVSPALP